MMTDNGKPTKTKYEFRFGIQDNLDHPPPVIKKLEDRFSHTYIVGKTGMGKSSLMEWMIHYDIEYGNAVIFLDPKGDSTHRIFSLHPTAEYISINNPTVINPLDKPEYHIDDIISEFVQILDVLIQLGSSNVPTTVYMKEIIGNAIRIIDDKENRNIKYLVDFLLYEDVRKGVTIKDEKLRKYWKEFDEKEDRNRYPKNKDKIETAKRVASRLMEISQGRMEDFVVGANEFDISDIVTEGRVVLVDTSKMSKNARNYLSNLIVYAVLAYTEFATIKPKPLMVYVDEFQVTVSDWFSEILARTRSRKVGFTLAHQSFAQIPKNILSVILDVVHAMVCFRTGDEVAMRLSHYFDVKPIDLFNLKKHFAWVRLGIDNTLTHIYKPLEVELIDTPTFKPSKETEEILDFLGDDLV
jgi:type IV secretory pathway VirB4 component